MDHGSNASRSAYRDGGGEGDSATYYSGLRVSCSSSLSL